MKTIYAFDFDGTITSRDTLIEFIRFVFGTRRMILGFLLHLPWLLLMRLGLYDNGKAKQRVFKYFFGGMELTAFNSHCELFAQSHAYLIRPDMERLLANLQEECQEVVVVSASITNWVAPFLKARECGLEARKWKWLTIVSQVFSQLPIAMAKKRLPACLKPIPTDLHIVLLPMATVVATVKCWNLPTKEH